MPFDPAQQTPDVPPLPGVGEALHEAAQAWARRGFKVFPLKPGEKLPAFEGWQQSATTDVATIKSMWSTRDWIDPATGEVIERFHPYNVGYVTDDLVVVDLDKKFDPNVDDVYRNQMLGDFDTLEVRTTSGGTHLIYRNPARDRATRTKIGGFSIDIKAVGGLAVAPGSRFAGGEYVLAEDRPIKLLPAHLLDWLPAARAKRNKSADVPLVDLDKPGAVAAAIRLAKGWKPGVEGSRGSDCYKLASLLRDRGIGEATAKAIIFEHWAPRCVDSQGNPAPFPLENEGGVQGVDETVAHAFEYAQNPPGCKTPEALLGQPNLSALLSHDGSYLGASASLPPPLPMPLPNELADLPPVLAARVMSNVGWGELTEAGVAKVFLLRYGGLYHFDHSIGKGYFFDGCAWRQDDKQLAFLLMHHVALDVVYQGEGKPADIQRLSRASTAAAALKLVQAALAISVTHDLWDRDPYLLGTRGGTVNLRTGELRAADPNDFITRLTAVAPAATADCPRFKAFLHQATGEDRALQEFLQRAAGYTLTGDVTEHALFNIHGPGRVGKSLFTNTIFKIMHDYGRAAAPNALTVTQGEKHPTYLAMLDGPRIVVAAETEQGKAWAEAIVKQMTGGDPITAHFMRKDDFTYWPRFKLWVVGNHMPDLTNVSDATKGRINVVPFVHKPAVPDPHLEDKLRGEWPGILRWMIDGCLMWQRDGLQRPPVVLAATAAYFESQDLYGSWMAERTILDAGGRERPDNLRSDFNAWAKRAGEKEVSARAFKEAFADRHHLQYRRIDGANFVTGIQLRNAFPVPPMPTAGIA